MVTPPMCAPVASGQNPENSPKAPRFGAIHLQLVGNPQNTFVGGAGSGVSVTRFRRVGAYINTTNNSPFK